MAVDDDADEAAAAAAAAAAAEVDGAFDQVSNKICLLLGSVERWLSPDAALC